MQKIITHLDAQESLFLDQQLNQISDRLFDYKRPQLNAREAFPISYEGDAGAEFITFRQFDETGEAKIIATAGDDLPIANTVMEEYQVKVAMLGNAFDYSVKEVKSSALANVDLESRRATASQKAIEQKLNMIAWNGDAKYKLQGFFNAPNIPQGSAITGNWNDPATTPQEMYDDVQAGIVAQVDLTKGVFEANEVWLPAGKLATIKSTRMAEGTDTTVATFIEMNLNVIFKSYAECSGAGAGSTDRMVIVNKNADNFTLEIPEELQVLAVQEINLSYLVPMYLQTAGVAVHQPYSVSFIDGI